jgi:hypothetical protein
MENVEKQTCTVVIVKTCSILIFESGRRSGSVCKHSRQRSMFEVIAEKPALRHTKHDFSEMMLNLALQKKIYMPGVDAGVNVLSLH